MENIWSNCEYKPNNIYNVDCYEAIKKIPDKSVDLIYTDPPYEYNQSYGKHNFGKRMSENKGLQIRKQQQQQIEKISYGFNYDILNEFVRVMKDIYIYIFGVMINKLLHI